MNMKKCKINSVYVAGLLRQLSLTCLMIFCLGFGLQAQDSGSGGDQSKVGEELDQFVNRFLDWVVVSYATYTGQHDAELESIFAKAKEALDKQPEVQAILQEIQSASSENGLEQVVRDFTNKTGIGVYFVPQIVNNNDGFYVPIFNDFMAEGAKNLVAPYVIVKPVIDGNNKSGYSISYSIETSTDLNSKKYNLDQANANNPFNAIAGQATKRKDLVLKLKPNLAGGVVALTNTVDENFLPKLVITYDGNVYRPGEEIEVGMETDSTAEIRLVAQNRDGSAPKRQVKWSISPETVERKVRGSDLLFPQTQAGQWAIMAESGSNKATVGVKVVNFNLDWKAIVKTILYEALQSQLEKTQGKIDSLEAAGAGNESELRTQLSKIEEANYPLEPDGSSLKSAYDEPQVLTGQDTVRFYSNEVRAEGFKKLRKFKKHFVEVLLQVNTAAFIDILVEDPKKFEELLENLVNDSGSLVIEIVTATLDQSERDGKIRKVVIDYLNANLVRLADAEFAGKHEAPALSAEAQPQATTNIPDAQDPNFYINPYVYFPGIDEFKTNLKAHLDSLSNPPFIVVNYSQDLSSGGFISRGQSGKPKGIGDRPYKVYTLINMPGSVMMDVFSKDGSPLDDATKGWFKTYCVPDLSLATVINDPQNPQSFITPAGVPIKFSFSDLLKDVTFGGFTCDGEQSSSVPAVLDQTLSGFTANGNRYVAVIELEYFDYVFDDDFLGYIKLDENEEFDEDKVDEYDYRFYYGNYSWDKNIQIQLPGDGNSGMVLCEMDRDEVDFEETELIEELPCELSGFEEIRLANLEALNAPLKIKVMQEIEYIWQRGRRYYLNEESQTANDYWITQLWNEMYGPYYYVNDDGYIDIHDYQMTAQQAFVMNPGVAARAVKSTSDLVKGLRTLAVLLAILDADFEISSGLDEAEILTEAANSNEAERLNIISEVVQFRQDVIGIIESDVHTDETLREFIHILFQLNKSLKNVFDEDSKFPFHLIDYRDLEVETPDFDQLEPKIELEENLEEIPILVQDPNLEQLTSYIEDPAFNPERYREDDEEEDHNAYVSIREIKYLKNEVGVTQPLFYVGITTEEDPIERYKNENTSKLVGSPLCFEIVARDIDKSTARGIEQLLILLNNNGSSFPSQSRLLDNQRNSTAPSREVYLYRLVKGYLYLESVRPDWKFFYKRNAKYVENRLRSQNQWIEDIYIPQN